MSQTQKQSPCQFSRKAVVLYHRDINPIGFAIYTSYAIYLRCDMCLRHEKSKECGSAHSGKKNIQQKTGLRRHYIRCRGPDFIDILNCSEAYCFSKIAPLFTLHYYLLPQEWWVVLFRLRFSKIEHL